MAQAKMLATKKEASRQILSVKNQVFQGGERHHGQRGEGNDREAPLYRGTARELAHGVTST